MTKCCRTVLNGSFLSDAELIREGLRLLLEEIEGRADVRRGRHTICSLPAHNLRDSVRTGPSIVGHRNSKPVPDVREPIP